MDLDKTQLMQILTKRFIQVTLDDGSVHAGYIGNPEDFQGTEMPSQMVLINGLLRDVIDLSRVTDVNFPKREDTTEIPIMDTVSMKNVDDD